MVKVSHQPLKCYLLRLPNILSSESSDPKLLLDYLVFCDVNDIPRQSVSKFALSFYSISQNFQIFKSYLFSLLVKYFWFSLATANIRCVWIAFALIVSRLWTADASFKLKEKATRFLAPVTQVNNICISHTIFTT